MSRLSNSEATRFFVLVVAIMALVIFASQFTLTVKPVAQVEASAVAQPKQGLSGMETLVDEVWHNVCYRDSAFGINTEPHTSCVHIPLDEWETLKP